MNYYTRADWGAKGAGSSVIGFNVGFTVHWQGTTTGAYPVSEEIGRVQAIERSHMSGKGWSAIAYNFLISRHGNVYEGRGWGIRSAANGDNVGNGTSIAVCYLGGPGDEFTSAAKEAFQELYAIHLSKGGLPTTYCHRDWVATGCPGDEICAWTKNQLPNAGPVVWVLGARELGEGDVGDDVLELTKLLNLIGVPTPITRTYTPGLASKVTEFQKVHGLGADGMVGPITLAAIKKLVPLFPTNKEPNVTPSELETLVSLVRTVQAELATMQARDTDNLAEVIRSEGTATRDLLRSLLA